ncbi:MAG: hypothetical protein KBA71_02310 [Opitutaceae bacterium]|nr:hypothetical protein [Opitutaceae bacterium]
MTLPPEVPRLSKLPFIAIDVLCLATAAYLALTAPAPLGGGSLIAVLILVALGAIALAVPFVAEYGRKTDAALAERQQQIAALAQSTAASAEQISIAAASLHDIGEGVARSAKSIESLPQKLHDKVAEFNTRLSEASAANTEELEQELQTLRSAESDRLVGAIDQLATTARELSRIETQIQAHTSRTADAIAGLPRLVDQTSARSAEALAQSLASARKDFESFFAQQRTLLGATALEPAVARATASLTSACNTLLGDMTARFASLKRSIEETPAAPASPSDAKERPPLVPPEPAARPAIHIAAPPAPASVTAASFREAPPAAQTAADKIHVRAPLTILEAEEAYPQTVHGSDHPDEETDLTRLPGAPAPLETRSTFPALVTPKAESSVPDSYDDELEDEESNSALTEDGSTRLLVTAYIGIGNKLFIRGNGAGLSWDKGVPLQFVSIGKWRWETDDAHRPITARLYKNDQAECASIGMFTLEPGHQREIVASF